MRPRFPKNCRKLWLVAILLLPPPAVAQYVANDVIAELVVTSQRREQPKLLHAGNIDRLDATTIAAVQHQHIHELLTRVSGVWISRASGLAPKSGS